MTFYEKYEHLFTRLEAFGKVYPAKFSKEVTFDELRSYAKNCLASQYPIIINHGKNILADLNRCNSINEPLF